ncbi:hypothetical protein RJO76_002862 [Aeromonas veronii]|nr:hypothetical protein [Aeromonas veronii]
MSIEDVSVIEEYLNNKFNEKFNYIQISLRSRYFKSINYTIYLNTSFIDNTDLYKDSIMERLEHAFSKASIEKNKDYSISRNVRGEYVVLPYYEIEV